MPSSTGGRIELKRVSYDVHATIEQMRQTEMTEELIGLAEQVLRTGGQLSV